MSERHFANFLFLFTVYGRSREIRTPDAIYAPAPKAGDLTWLAYTPYKITPKPTLRYSTDRGRVVYHPHMKMDNKVY